jgi:hypothetical protein
MLLNSTYVAYSCTKVECQHSRLPDATPHAVGFYSPKRGLAFVMLANAIPTYVKSLTHITLLTCYYRLLTVIRPSMTAPFCASQMMS